MGYVSTQDLKVGASLLDTKDDETWTDNEWGVIV